MGLYFQMEEENELAIIVQNTLIEDKGIVLNGRPYVSTEVVKEYLNDRFYWDSAENLYIYTTPTEMITAHVGENQYSTDKRHTATDYQIVKVEDGIAYVALEYVKQHTAMEYEYMEEPNRVQITNEFGEIPVVEAKKKSEVRYRAGVKSPILTDVKKGDLLYVLDEGENQVEKWTKVRTADGYIGYIKDNKLREPSTITTSNDFVEPEYTSLSKDYTINLAWHQVTNQEANNQVLEKIADAKGLTTISPTWFFIKDDNGNIQSLASQSYVDYCHQNGVEVWGLVENITYKDQFDITTVLNKTSSRQNLVTQLIAQAIQYDLDGINVDIEALPGEAGDGFIEFVRELSIMCRRNNIILSVDNYVPMAYNQNYNRKEQGIVADYVIIMGYDEHFAGSEEAGSVASIGYVRNGIEKTLEEVPAEKVINAVPFYTRLWQTNNSGELSSSALGMSSAAKTVANNNATPEWLEEAGQYYAEFENSDGFYQIWMEEERSIEEKAKLIKEYGLAGIASWRLGYEKDEIWDVILKYVN
ncbi:MAG: glycosyl hydrolase family 18 [Lachnospiraceae bacterium]|nr:glycosyl hydrolase family 18 [Lachnospiraceae bacterium]